MDTLTNKREPPKKLHNDYDKPYRNVKRKQVKLSKLSVGYIISSKKKNQSFGNWVSEACEYMYHEKERRKEELRIRSMTDSSTYHENVQLRKDVDELMREVDKIKDINDIFIKAEVRQKLFQKRWDKKMDKFWAKKGLLSPKKRNSLS